MATYIRAARLVMFALMAIVLSSASASSQDFELNAPELGVRSAARLTETQLQIMSAEGARTDYTRDTRFDSPDKQWLGFYSHAANQVLRWPASHQGHMQIGRPVAGGIEYRPSQMAIRLIGGTAPQRIAQKPTTPQIEAAAGSLLAELAISKLFDVVSRGDSRLPAQMLRIASYDTRGAPWVLSRGAGYDLSVIRSGSSAGVDWWVAPAGAGYVRVETYDRGRVFAVSAAQTGGLALLPVSQDPRQLWRVSGGHVTNRFLLENVAFPGNCLSRASGGGVLLQPIQYAPSQLWVSYAAPTLPAIQPFWRSVSTEIVANSPLPPARLDLENSHRYALIVLVGDTRQGNAFEKIRIEPGQTQTIQLERDSGATLVETVEVRSALGAWESRQYVTAIPPRTFYDLSVYEEHLQSIAIDATGKSPNPIEDVNYVPKSVGWLQLPAGAELPAHGRIDAFQRAKAANNPGAVRRMDPKEFDEPSTTNPLEKILEKYQTTPRRKF